MGIGEQLRQAREQRNVSLHAIAEKTNISVRFLDAIEKGQIDKLPGGIFTRGFVRSYAAQVGLDPDETVRAFVTAHPEVRAADEVDEGEPTTRTGAVLRAVVLVLLAAAVVAGAVYWWTTREGRASTAVTPQAPVAHATPATPARVDSPAEQGGAAPASVEVAASEAEPAAPVAENTATGETDGALPAAMPPETPAASTMPLRLTVTPSGRCWVQVKADGRVRLAREVLPGERVDIEAAEQLEIVAGDAGAFGYQVNGATGRSLGAAGRVGRATITMANLADYRERVP